MCLIILFDFQSKNFKCIFIRNKYPSLIFVPTFLIFYLFYFMYIYFLNYEITTKQISKIIKILVLDRNVLPIYIILGYSCFEFKLLNITSLKDSDNIKLGNLLD